MKIDIAHHIGAVSRTVESRTHDGQPAHAVIASREYDTTVDDLWDALTSKERIPRWFLPVSGDLRLGGRYQLQGNAAGTITRCEPPRHLAVTWEFGGQVSWVDVRLAPTANGRAHLELQHVMPVPDATWDQYGPGAVGVGWTWRSLASRSTWLLAPPSIRRRQRPGSDPRTARHSRGRAATTGVERRWRQAPMRPQRRRLPRARSPRTPVSRLEQPDRTRPPDETVMQAFDVLGNPVRRRILELLAEGTRSSGEIAEVVQREFDISQPAISQHLRVLRESGFATVRVDGPRRMYDVSDLPLGEIDAWLGRFRRLWSQRLDALATEVARGKRARRARDAR